MSSGPTLDVLGWQAGRIDVRAGCMGCAGWLHGVAGWLHAVVGPPREGAPVRATRSPLTVSPAPPPSPSRRRTPPHLAEGKASETSASAAPRTGARAASRGPGGRSCALEPTELLCASARAPRAVVAGSATTQDDAFGHAATPMLSSLLRPAG
eukprot:scaffold99250_cov69-Phaeocystis_antarctica.AAC.5